MLLKNILLLFFLIYTSFAIDIAYVSDDACAFKLAASIASLLENKSDSDDIKIYVLTPNFRDETIKRLKSIVKTRGEIKFFYFDFAALDKLNQLDNMRHFPTTAYAKALIPNMLSDLDKVLYIDADTLILGSLKELWETELKDNYVAAVQDEAYWGYLDKILNRIVYNNLYKDIKKMFNSGVMLLNLKKCRENNIRDKFLYQMGNVKHFFGDETIFYYLFYGKILYVEPKWNSGPLIRNFKLRAYTMYSKTEIEKAKHSPVTLHLYDDSYKDPLDNFHWMFMSYLYKTPWKYKITDVLKERAKRTGSYIKLTELIKEKFIDSCIACINAFKLLYMLLLNKILNYLDRVK